MKVATVISLLSLSTFALAKDSSTTTSQTITDAYVISTALLSMKQLTLYANHDY